jgi:hypothetical protein
MSSESAEVIEISSISKVQYWDDKTTQDVLAELGDCCWYLNLACSCIAKEFGLSSFYVFPVNDAFSSNLVFNQGTSSMTISSGVFCDIIKAHLFYGKSLNTKFADKTLEAYYAGIVLCCSALNTTLETVLEKNIAKLTTRYGDTFSEKRALIRDLKKEEIAYSK